MRFSPSRLQTLILLLSAAGLVLALTSCSGPRFRRADRTSSIVEYLYPGVTNPLAPTALPVLHLPLRVGVAFVPSANGPHPYGSSTTISEMQRAQLLQRVAHAFEGKDYIAAIEIVPSTYLRPAGGFENLEQVRRMLNLDVVALVSYDQVQFTDQNRLSLAYWTIVGAYFLDGNKNDTQTLMEAAVYDIASHQLLFRAPGAGRIKASSTLLQVDERLRSDSGQALQLATDDMIANLRMQLEDFRERMKTAPDTVAKIERRPGYTGAGAVSRWFALCLVGIFAWSQRRPLRRAMS